MLFDNKWKQLHNEYISLYKNLHSIQILLISIFKSLKLATI